nr:hypothetical protein [Tanacetum cinerariifolium]
AGDDCSGGDMGFSNPAVNAELKFEKEDGYAS